MYKERCIWLNHLEDMLKRDIFFICHNMYADAGIDGTMSGVLRQIIRFSKKHNKAAIIIQTPGGSLDETFYICSFFREHYDEVDTYIVGDCYSGGTMIALSSDNIYMSPNACLGAIDIQHGIDPNNPWAHELYGMVTAFDKALTDGKADEVLLDAFWGNEHVLAAYFKMNYNYKKLAGKFVKKHCIKPKKWKKIWEYLAELNLSHGSPLTYKKCRELGLDVKKMPKELEAVIGRIVRDAQEEFGGLVNRSVLCDYYDSPEGGNIIKQMPLLTSDGKVSVNMFVNRSTETLGFIETSQAGYIQESEVAVTWYGLIPNTISPIKVGWREEYNTSLVCEEEESEFEQYIEENVRGSFEYAGLDANSFNSQSRLNVSNLLKKQTYDAAMENLKYQGVDIDSLSAGERWKATVDYALQTKHAYEAEESEELKDRLYPALENEAKRRGYDFDNMTDEEKSEVYSEFFQDKLIALIEDMGATEKEFFDLDEEEQQSLLVEYISEFEE